MKRLLLPSDASSCAPMRLLPTPVRLLLCALVLLAVGAPAAARANAPVLPGEYPDPTVIQYGGQYVAAATSDRWEPVFPIVTSPDLKTWTQVGAVFDQAPTWATGQRFWAPEFAEIDGRLVVLYSGLKRNGQWCIGAASTVSPAGPWTDEGPILCPPQGAIDPAYAEENGQGYLLYKLKGVGAPIQIAPMDKALLTVTGPATTLITPIPVQDGGVTEGPAVMQHDGRSYLFFSTGGCCKPPCTYTQQVARSSSLLGPYERMDQPLLRTDANFSCPGHGTPVTGPDGATYLLHHGYGPDYPDDRRREGILTKLRWTSDGWPAAADGGVGNAGPSGDDAITDPALTPTPPTYSDLFTGPGLDRAWQRPITRSAPTTALSAGKLELACGPGSLAARQIAKAPFDVTVSVRAPVGSTAAVGFRDSGGTLRGVQVRDGLVRTVRQTSKGRVLAAGPGVATAKGRGVRLQLSARAGGQLFASLSTPAGPRALVMGPAASGRKPVRLGLACSGTGRAAFSGVKVTGGDWVTSQATGPASFAPEGVGVPIAPLKR